MRGSSISDDPDVEDSLLNDLFRAGIGDIESLGGLELASELRSPERQEAFGPRHAGELL